MGGNFLRIALLIAALVAAAALVLRWEKPVDASTLIPADEIHGQVDTGDIPVEQDLCLHCHAYGTPHEVWGPTLRWLAFGAGALVFAYGTYRSVSLWKGRRRWKSFWERTVEWLDERYGIVEPMEKILKKPVPMSATRWFYCLGGLTFLFFLIQGLTGIMMVFYYEPSADPSPTDPSVSVAYASIEYIMNEVRFGNIIRTIHHWGANGMIVLAIAHMIRVFIMGAYRPPRELNWISGVFLLIITLGFGFTGYLLPWDQRAYWATTVGTDIAGNIPVIGQPALLFLRAGWQVTGLTLSRFFALHVMVFPILALAFMGLHFLMIRRLGIHRPL